MDTETETLIALLRTLASVPNLGSSLRRAARRALVADDVMRIRLVARAIAEELQRRGELVRVAGAVGAPTAAIFVLRHDSRLLDLTPLESAARRAEALATPTPSAAADRSQQSAAALALALTPAVAMAPDEILTAMEGAQRVLMDDPQPDQTRPILESILDLLGQFVSHLRLYIMVHDDDTVAQGAERLFASDSRTGPLWLSTRARGAAVWIPSLQELPEPIRKTLVLPSAGEAGVAGDAAPAFFGAVAMPLMEPTGEAVGGPRSRREAGLLFVVPQRPLARGQVMRLSRRLAHFVTGRWHHLREVNRSINTDSLTGVRNRAFFDAQLPLEVERARRQHLPLALVLCDLDHFKQVNDQYGHQAGDVVLRLVARELQRGLRRIDHVCRIGGEEFALLLPDTAVPAAQEVVTRLLGVLNEQRLTVPGAERPLAVTLSLGVVAFPDGGGDHKELYRKADAMLYRSKRTGRNRCSVWNQQGEPSTLLPPAPSA